MKGSDRKGFTLIEIIVTIVIMIVLGVIALSNLSGTKASNDLTVTATEIRTLLRQAQNDSMEQKGEMRWGVYFANSTNTGPYFALYSSSTYSTSTSAAIYQLPSTVGFLSSSIPSGSSTSISFSTVLGATTSTSVILYLLSSPSTQVTITVNSSGLVQ